MLRRRHKTWVAVCVVLLAAGGTWVRADEAGVTVGEFWGGPLAASPEGEMEVDNHFAAGVFFDHDFDEFWGLMIRYERVPTGVDGTDLDLDLLDVSGVIRFRWSNHLSYFPFGVGASRSDLEGTDSVTRFTAHVGAGVRFALSENLGVRLEGRYRYLSSLANLPDPYDEKAVNTIEASLLVGYRF